MALVLVCPRDHSSSLSKSDGSDAEKETSRGPWAEARKLADELNSTLKGIVKEAAGAGQSTTADALKRLNPKFSRALLLVGRLQAAPYILSFFFHLAH